MAHKCQFCDFTSERAYNVKRHTIRRHNIQENENVQTVAKNVQNVAKNVQNVVENVQNVVKNVQNVVTEKTTHYCGKCGKYFCRPCRVSKHEEKCKGVRTLQCDICNMVFQDRHDKYNHKRYGKCSPPSPSVTNITNNITNNNITNNNNIINNNVNIDQSVKINYISFNTKNNDPIEFHTDHIDDPKILKEIFAEPNFLDMFANYAEAVLSAKENQIVQKQNLSRDHAIVYLMDKDTNVYILDKQIFYKYARGLSTSAMVLSDKHKKKAPLPCDHREYLRDIAIDCEASPCSTYDDEDLRYSKRTRDAIHIAKVKTHQQTMKSMNTTNEEDI